MLFNFKRLAFVAAVSAALFAFSSCEEQAKEELPVDYGDVSIADVLGGEVGNSYSLTAMVVGANEQGVILQQGGSDRIYAFKGEAHGLVIGDIVDVEGTTGTRNGLIQFGTGCSLVKKDHRDNVAFPKAENFTAKEIQEYMGAPAVKYVSYTGVVLISGNYTNFEIEGTDIVGSLDYMTDEFKEKYSGHELTITGWLFGSYKTYLYTVPVHVEDHGVKEEEVPEGAIYYSTFDASLASQNYGSDGGSWPFLDDFDGWKDHKGSGVADVTYSYQKISARTNQSSKGSLSLYEGSGKNNIFFSTAPNYFIIEKIAVPSEKLHLSFGAQRYAQGASNAFINSDFEVRLSADGQSWSRKLDYDFNGVADEAGQWRLASADFTLPAGTKTLYIKFVAKMSSVNRLDDVLLVPGNGGQEVIFGQEDEVIDATIAEAFAATPNDKTYRVNGQVIATHSKGFLIKDATGTMLVFKKNHGMETGYNVTVEGVTSTYGGLNQFGETSIVTKTSEGTFTQPQPEEFTGADFTAYAAKPVIKYISYTGDLTSFRDNIYQMHYNVAIEGTDVMAAVQYPLSSLSIDKYVGSKVKVTGYATGVSVSDGTSYVNTMTTSIEFLEKEEMPSEDDAVSVKELNAKIGGMKTGASLAEIGAVVGYVAANNQGGALYQVISLVDNTGEAGSGIIVKDEDFTEETLPVGTKVIISLKRATYDNNKGLPQIRKATIFKTDKKASIVVPEIDDSQCGDYLGQYVKVKNLTPPADATTWVVNNASTTVKFTGEKGNTVASYVTKYAVYKDEKIAQRKADLLGVMEVYNGLYELIPTSMADVAGFKE